MKKYKVALISIVAIVGLIALPADVVAQSADQIIVGADATDQSGSPDLETQIRTITNVLMFLIGAIAVIVLIIGGIKYVVSDGDQAKLKSAKDTILYAVIGIVIALLAYALVNFVVTAFVG